MLGTVLEGQAGLLAGLVASLEVIQMSIFGLLPTQQHLFQAHLSCGATQS